MVNKWFIRFQKECGCHNPFNPFNPPMIKDFADDLSAKKV